MPDNNFVDKERAVWLDRVNNSDASCQDKAFNVLCVQVWSAPNVYFLDNGGDGGTKQELVKLSLKTVTSVQRATATKSFELITSLTTGDLFHRVDYTLLE